MELKLSHVTFAYSENLVLKDINLTIKRGEKIGIIGKNGTGKSTLLHLIVGLVSLNAGKILINGIEISEVDMSSWRAKIAMVSQTPYLFKETVRDNVDLCKTKSEKDIVDACENSGAIDFVKEMRKGFEQVLGVNGSNLSGGEKQKIAVARAILKDADLLLLDEASTGYDVASSCSLHKNLNDNFKGKTIVLITHDYHDLKYFDRVYELEAGVLVEKAKK